MQALINAGGGGGEEMRGGGEGSTNITWLTANTNINDEMLNTASFK